MSSPRKIILKSSDNEQFEIDEAVAFMSQTIKHVIEDTHADNGIPLPNVTGIPLPNVIVIKLPNVTGMILAKVIEYCKKRAESGLTEAAAGEDIKDQGAGMMNWSSPEDSQRMLTPNALGAQGDWAAEFEYSCDLFRRVCSCGDCWCGQCSFWLNNNIYTNSAAKEAFKKWDAEYLKVDQATLIHLINAADYLNIKGLLKLTTWTVVFMIKGMTTEEIRNFFNIENDFTPEEEEEVRRENLWAIE